MTDQLSLLPDLDRASDSRKQNLCATWKNARANDCDVTTSEARTRTTDGQNFEALDKPNLMDAVNGNATVNMYAIARCIVWNLQHP